MQTPPEDRPAFISVPEIARGAGVTGHTVSATFRRAGVLPDAVLFAGRSSMPLFAQPRYPELVALVNGKFIAPTLEAQ